MVDQEPLVLPRALPFSLFFLLRLTHTRRKGLLYGKGLPSTFKDMAPLPMFFEV